MAQQTSVGQIPFYQLYGDAFQNTEPGFVHLEDIAARSGELDWEIAPHRHKQLTQFICVLNNSFQLMLDDNHHKPSGNQLIIIPPGVVHGFRFNANTEGYVLTVHSSLLENYQQQSVESKHYPWLWSPTILALTDQRYLQQFLTLLQLLAAEITSHSSDSKLATENLLALLLISIRRQQHWQRLQSHELSRESRVLIRFRDLLDEHYRQQLGVKAYADKLHISTSTLNRICQQLLQCTPKALIQQRLLSEIKRRLIYTRQSLEEIAANLGFADLAYFCRFFKQHTGVTAGDFRKTHELG